MTVTPVQTQTSQAFYQKHFDTAKPKQTTSTQSAKPSQMRTAIADGVGLGIGCTAPIVVIADNFKTYTPSELENLKRTMQYIAPEIEPIQSAENSAKQIILQKGLDKKGVKLFVHRGSVADDQKLYQILDANGANKGLGKRQRESYFQMFKSGTNAAYWPKTKDIVLSAEGTTQAIYHELGHAMNANCNIFTKALQKSRLILTPMGVSIMAPIALGVGLFHKVDKTKPKNEKGKLERTADFIKNNCGTLTAASYLPMLAEEGLASARGVKAAKQFLKPEQITQLSKNYLRCWGTYLSVAAGVSLGVGIAVKVADAIKNKKSNKTIG